MTKAAIFIRHKTLPGKRDEVQAIWARHMQPAIAGNSGHEFYFYCFNDAEPDSVCVYQQYVDQASAQAFLRSESYAIYRREVQALLSETEVVSATPVWSKTTPA